MSWSMNALGHLLAERAGLERKSHRKLSHGYRGPEALFLYGDAFAEALGNHFDLNKSLAGQKQDDFNISLGQIVVVQFHLRSLNSAQAQLLRG